MRFDYFRDNWMKIISFLGLLVGGFLFLAYYLYIGYLPQIDNIADLTYMLFAMAISGIFFILIFTFSFLFPSFFYNRGIEKDIKTYVNSMWFGISIMIFPVITFIVLIGDIYYGLKLNTLSIYAGMMIVIFIWFYWKVRNKWKTAATDRKLELFWVLLVFSIVGFLPMAIIYVVFILSGQSNITTNEDALIAFLVFTGFIFISNMIAVTSIKDKIAMQMISGLVSIIILMSIFHTYALIPSTIMNTFRLGNFFIVKIHAKQRSCHILHDLHLKGLKIKNETNDMCVIEGKICVLSKIGTKMLWKINMNGIRTIELPSEDFSGMITDPADNSKCVVYQKPNDYNKSKH